MKSKVLVSVVIPVFRGGGYIEGCLESLLASNFSDFEVVVVDDGMEEKDKRIMWGYEKKRKVKVVDLGGNFGASRARNAGVLVSKGKYILFLDIDTKIGKNSLKKGVGFLEKHNGVGVIQAKLLRKDGKIDAAGHFLSILGFPYEIGVGEDPKEHDEERMIFGARSAGMMMRRDIFDQVGGFDEDYMIYGEETDLCWRIWLAGKQVFYAPEFKVWHFGKSSMKKRGIRVAYEGSKNNVNYILKNCPISVLWYLLPFNCLGWLFLMIKFLIEGRVKMSKGVLEGWWWNVKNLEKTIKKRKKVKSLDQKGVEVNKIMFGDLSWGSFLVKGFSWFKSV